MLCYAVALAALAAGTALAVQKFPEPFDWAYTVMSALASRKHNPEGGWWFAGALGIAAVFLWPVVERLRASTAPPDRLARLAILALRFGVVCALLVGIERLLIFHASALVRKSHEALALTAFLGFYAGTLGLYAHRAWRERVFLWPALLIVLPVLASGASQFALYVSQRDLGWVDRSWRELGVPFWLSLAFWQWLAAVMLLAGLGALVWFNRPGGKAHFTRPAPPDPPGAGRC